MTIQRRKINGCPRFPWVRAWREGRWIVIDVRRARFEVVR